MLRDRLVCGINDNRLQRRLLAEANLTFKKAYEIAQAMEAAERSAKELQGTAADSVGTRGICEERGRGSRRLDIKVLSVPGKPQPQQL